MHSNYNINQTSLAIALDYIPEENHPARFINDLVESLKPQYQYQFGRPHEYDLGAMLKLILLSYSYGIFSSRKIVRFAHENKPAGWLINDQVPSYRTICRFRISDELAQLTQDSLSGLTQYLRAQGLIDDVSFIDGTKILADANKYTFVWKKNTIRFDELNREKLVELLGELRAVELTNKIPEGSDLTLNDLHMVLASIEDRLICLDEEVEKAKKVFPNPAKQERRHLKSQYKKISARTDKMLEYQNQSEIYGNRNSYSKTDHDATFMRVKEDPMLNGQLKPAYNLQIATNNQFTTGFMLFPNPTDTRTLPDFISHLDATNVLGSTIVADAGYGSERNYRFCEDNYGDHTVLIPYGTMLKEQSRKWRSDDRKVMNWQYDELDDFYVDPHGVRFNFKRYSQRTDKYGFKRDFKVYQAERHDENHEIIPEALTKSGRARMITINGDWEYFKAKQRELLSAEDTGAIYARRKIDVESVFGRLKASLRFTRFSVRGMDRVSKEMGIVLMAMNINKLATITANYEKDGKKKSRPNFRNLRFLVYFFITELLLSQLHFF